MTRKWISLLLAGILLLSACAKKEPKTKEASLDPSWSEIIKRGTIVVCLTEEQEEFYQFSKELVQALCDRLGIGIEFTNCSRKEAIQKIKKKQADLAFAESGKEIGCSQPILTVGNKNYSFLYRKGDSELATLIAINLQGMADETILTQLCNQFFEQDYSAIRSQIDTGLPTEEEAEEYDKRLKEMR